MQDEAIRRILDFWFSAAELDAPQIDSRMERWFSTDPAVDQRIREEFSDLVDEALQGRLDHWAATTEGRLALILLLDQFCRNIHRGTARAFAGDKRALKLCVEGSMNNDYRYAVPHTASVLLHAAAARRIARRAGQVGAHLQRAGATASPTRCARRS